VTGDLLLDVKIPGEPPTKERARTFVGGDQKSHTVTPGKTRAWEQMATAYFRIARPARPIVDGAPIALRITAVASRPARLREGVWADRPGRLPCVAAPDADNIAKIVMDALAPSRTSRKKAWICILRDDAVIVDAQIRKLYAAIGEKPHIRIQVFTWTPDADIDERYVVEEAPIDVGEPVEPVTLTGELTLAEARRTLEAAGAKGSTCPCCDQFVKRYSRPLNATMARSLLWLVKTAGPDCAWIDVGATAPAWLLRTKELATTRHWELIEERPREQDPEVVRGRKRTSGFWRPTSKGVAFARNELRVPSHVVLYNNQVEGWSKDEIGITDALGEHFNYAELMADR